MRDPQNCIFLTRSSIHFSSISLKSDEKQTRLKVTAGSYEITFSIEKVPSSHFAQPTRGWSPGIPEKKVVVKILPD